MPLPGTLKRQTAISASHGNLAASRPDELNVTGTMPGRVVRATSPTNSMVTSPMRGLTPGVEDNAPESRSPMLTGNYVWGDRELDLFFLRVVFQFLLSK